MAVDELCGFGNSCGWVAVYARLSVNENGERDESLETQCQLLEAYAEENEFSPVNFYIDSDVSGTCFDRPGLIRLIKDINNNLIRVILVKDLSRLGRNNGETLTFLDFLREKNIRLISLGDNYDSFVDDDEIIGIKTWVNEHYARDISKKVRYNLRKKMQNGEFLGRPPFGYLKSAVDKNKLIVDERYREIIRKIFELYIDGWGYRALAEYVQETGTPTPSQDKAYLNAPKSRRWNEQHIRRIITNRVYCGDTVQGVSEKISFKSKKTRRVSSEKWVIVPDTHEAIISKEMFSLAQEIRKKRQCGGQGRKSSVSTAPHLFTGFIVCGGCGSRHTFRQRGTRPPVYICGNYNRLGRKACTSHHIAEKKLIQFIKDDIQIIAAGIPFRERLIREYTQDNNSREIIVNKIHSLAREITLKQKQLQTAYLDRTKGIVSEQLFLNTKLLIEKELRLLLNRRIELTNELKRRKKLESQVQRIVNNWGSELLPKLIKEIDISRTFLEHFVEKIIVVGQNDTVAASIKRCLERNKLDGELLQMVEYGQKKVIIIYKLCPLSV